MTPFQGVDHVGVGVSDVDEAIEFYGRHVGFDQVLFDHTGELPGLEAYAGRTQRARVAMLANGGATPIGPGRVKLVQVLDDGGPPPVPEGQAWGEVGVCEICLHVRGVQGVHDALVAAGCASLMEPMSADVPPNGVTLDIAYVADPWGTKLEMIEWTGLWRSLPGPSRAEGVNHVAFGVTDMARTRSFYERLGFTALLFESFEFFDPMAPWYQAPWYDPANLPAQHMTMPMAAQGAAIEPVVLNPPAGHDCRGEWGHLGPMDFGVRVPNVDTAVAELRADGVEVHGDPVTVDLGGGREWRYAAIAEPDGNYVTLVEARY
jgi:catechol 2,3-dioxygenase-like lactoylglutathione lyase family enzyme